MGAVLAIGYSNGKTVFNGAEEVHFLDNRELCEEEGNAQWVFLGVTADVKMTPYAD